ncbi:MAG TPA: universal stress protein [Steroidobacter sp.]
MSPTETILVIVDPRANHHAGLAKGALLAQKSRARIHLFACNSSGATDERYLVPADESGRDEEMSSMLQALARPLRERGLEVTTQTARGDSLNHAIAECVKDTRSRLVINDIHQHAVTRRASLTHGDWELIRSCPAALLLSKPTLWPGRPKICAAIDPGHSQQAQMSLDQAVLEQAVMLARQLEGELHVLHAYIPPAFVVPVPAVEDFRMLESSHQLVIAQSHARLRSLKALASGYGVPDGHVHVTIGPVCDVLSSLVRELKASILVMGAVSRSALRADVIGSTAEALLEKIACDVLVVSTPDSAIPLH